MTSAFNSNEEDCINRATDVEAQIGSIAEIWDTARLAECKTWIETGDYKKVSDLHVCNFIVCLVASEYNRISLFSHSRCVYNFRTI